MLIMPSLALRKVFLLCLLFVFVPSLFAQQSRAAGSSPYRYDRITDHLSSLEIGMLSAENEVSRVDLESFNLSLPPAPLVSRVNEFVVQDGNGIATEGLFFIPLTLQQQRQVTPIMLYNITRAVSTLEGIQYFSDSRGQYRTLYDISYVIDSPATQNRRDDPLVTSIPSNDIRYLQQKDSTFGENIYRARYTHQDTITSVEITNLTAMRYAVLQSIDPEELRTLFSIIPTDRGLFLYGASLMQTDILFGLEERTASHLTNRLKAMFGWFEQSLAERVGE